MENKKRGYDTPCTHTLKDTEFQLIKDKVYKSFLECPRTIPNVSKRTKVPEDLICSFVIEWLQQEKIVFEVDARCPVAKKITNYYSASPFIIARNLKKL